MSAAIGRGWWRCCRISCSSKTTRQRVSSRRRSRAARLLWNGITFCRRSHVYSLHINHDDVYRISAEMPGQTYVIMLTQKQTLWRVVETNG